MSQWELQYLGAQNIPPNLSAVEIEHFFTLRPAELDAVSKGRRTSNRLGLALHVGFLKFSGTVLNSTDLIPQAVLAQIAKKIAPGSRAPQIASIRSVYRRRVLSQNFTGLGDLRAFGLRGGKRPCSRVAISTVRSSSCAFAGI